jgi:two-component system nitrate/nitrite sensor histidine kinase NarX
MTRPWPLAAKLVAAGTAFLAFALVCVGATLWVTWQLEGGAAAVNEAGRMRMQSYRLGLAVAEGRHDRIPHFVAQFDHSIELLREGDPGRPLFVPWDAEVTATFDAVQRRWRTLRAEWPDRGLPHADTSGEADGLAGDVDRLVTAIERHMSRWTSMMQLLQMAMLALAIAAAVLLLYIAYVVVLEPVDRLQRGLAEVEAGALDARVEVAADDEFGRLGEAFNRMAARLEDSYRSLEDKVRAKTAGLALEQERLACLYDVVAHIATATDVDALTRGFAGRIARAAGADAAAIRWADPARRQVVMLASYCLPESIAQGEACLQVGDCHCGALPTTDGARVIPIRPDAPAVGARCAEAGFASVVTLPVRQHDEPVGEVELFFRQPVVLKEHERTLLEALVAHLASAIEGLRLQALQRETAVSQERGLLAQELHDSIAQSLAFLKIQVQLLRGALGRGDARGVEAAIAEIDSGVRESSGDVRELLLHFRTRADADDIGTALRTTLSKFEHQTGVPTSLRIEGQGLPLLPDVQVQVLHVIQEALSNVRKHAGAGQVRIEVAGSPRWRFVVTDDGRGFVPDGPAPDETHVGLRIMRERAERIGASLSIDAAPGLGTKVTLTLPGPEPASVADRVSPGSPALASAA